MLDTYITSHIINKFFSFYPLQTALCVCVGGVIYYFDVPPFIIEINFVVRVLMEWEIMQTLIRFDVNVLSA